MSMSQRSIAAYTTRRPYDSSPFLSHAQSVTRKIGDTSFVLSVTCSGRPVAGVAHPVSMNTDTGPGLHHSPRPPPDPETASAAEKPIAAGLSPLEPQNRSALAGQELTESEKLCVEVETEALRSLRVILRTNLAMTSLSS